MHRNITQIVRIALGLSVSVGIAGAASADLTTGPTSRYYLDSNNGADDQDLRRAGNERRQQLPMELRP